MDADSLKGSDDHDDDTDDNDVFEIDMFNLKYVEKINIYSFPRRIC